MRVRKVSIFTKLIVLGLIVYTAVTLVNLQGQIKSARETQAALQETVAEKNQENAELRYDIEHSDDPETIEQIARDKLGLVKPGEKVFYDSN